MKILIFDDSSTYRKIAKSILQSESPNNHILEADNGFSALDILQQNKDFDLILSDINMPGLTGIEFAKKIRDNKSLKHINIIFMSTEATRENFTEAIKLGASGFLRKPLKKEVLLDNLKKVKKNIEENKIMLNHHEKIEFINKLNINSIIEFNEDRITIQLDSTYLEIPLNRAIFYKYT